MTAADTAGANAPMENEAVYSNAREGVASLSICVPSYRDDATTLIARLGSLPGIERCTLLVYDDGTADAALTASHKAAIDLFPAPARLITASQNIGRSHARNRMIARAEADWLLLLDADMLPDDRGFLACYLGLIDIADSPMLVAGGFSLEQVEPAPNQRLHAAQAAKSDCLTAEDRSADPGRYVFTSNILVHREILDTVTFDEGFIGWGWEDVDWGLRVAKRYPIMHVENTATHLGLETDTSLIARFGTSGMNYARLVSRHPEATKSMALTRVAKAVKYVPFVKSFASGLSRAPFLPTALRLTALKLYRASSYAKYL